MESRKMGEKYWNQNQFFDNTHTAAKTPDKNDFKNMHIHAHAHTHIHTLKKINKLSKNPTTY